MTDVPENRAATHGLRTGPATGAPDDLYAALIDAHRGLTDAQSRQFDARLILLLANHVGDPRILAEAIAAARRGLEA
ncbi:MAG: DUF2783 domain-containing protein [Inquilinaceae bacterium]